jgi:YesN/AraC family two-component response regulator
MNQRNLLGWVDCANGNEASPLIQSVPYQWEIVKANTANALQVIGNRQPHALVFDFNYTSKASLHLLLAVKRQYSGIPILMVTEEHSENLAVWAFRARVWNYFAKPVSICEFNRNLAQLAKVSANRGSDNREIERPGSMFPGQSVDGTSSQALIEHIAEVVRRDYASGLRAGDLARSLKLSRFQFNRLFQRSFGCSLHTYVTRLRVGSACHLIRKAGAAASVTEISLAVGIQDASYFARVFRHVIGESPTGYARRMSAKPPDQELAFIEPTSNDEVFATAQSTG